MLNCSDILLRVLAGDTGNIPKAQLGQIERAGVLTNIAEPLK